MLRITQKQMDLLDAACFRHNAIGFVEGELRLFDDATDPANIAVRGGRGSVASVELVSECQH